jgi:hypothetical protein
MEPAGYAMANASCAKSFHARAECKMAIARRPLQITVVAQHRVPAHKINAQIKMAGQKSGHLLFFAAACRF